MIASRILSCAGVGLFVGTLAGVLESVDWATVLALLGCWLVAGLLIGCGVGKFISFQYREDDRP